MHALFSLGLNRIIPQDSRYSLFSSKFYGLLTLLCCVNFFSFRLPGYGSTGGLMFYCWCLLSTRDLRAPSANRCKTLPRDRKWSRFYGLGLKI